MRTIKEWYELLPQSIKEKAIDNIVIQRSVEYLNGYHAETLKDAVNCFTWSSTIQGQEYWSMVYEDCKFDIYSPSIVYSSSFLRMLRTICETSQVAQILKMKQYSTHTDFANYITMRGEMGSYLPNGRQHKITDDGKWSRDGRQEMKIAKLARKLIKQSYLDDLTDADFEKFTNCVKSYISMIGDEDGNGKKIELRLINGTKIYDAYYEDNYSSILGKETNLWGSCMRHESCQNYLDIYVDNTDACQLLIAEDKEGLILGRALVWKLDDGRVAMDTIYAHESIKESFVNYAIEHGWYYKSSQSCHHHSFDRFDGKFNEDASRKESRVTLKHFRYSEFPYMDSLYNLSDTGVLSNHEFTCNYKILRDTGGGYEDGGMIECEWTGRWICEDDSTYIEYERPNGQHFEGRVSDDEVVYTADEQYVLCVDAVEEYSTGSWYLRNSDEICSVPSRDEYRLIDDCMYSDYLHEWILSEEALETGDGKIMHMDSVFECCIDGEVYDECDCMSDIIDGVEYRYYTGNQEQFFEKFKLVTNETGVN
jgi:hypothetical protein